MCAMQTGVFFLSLSGSGWVNSSIYIEGLPAVLEGMGRLVCSTGCTKQCHLCPKISKLFGTFILGWPGLVYNWYIWFCYFLPFWSLIIFTRLLIILSSQIYCVIFIYSVLLLINVECLLSLLESWAPASSLTTFKLAWKTATLLALVTAKWSLLYTDNQHLIMLLFSSPCLVAGQIIWVIFLLRFIVSF